MLDEMLEAFYLKPIWTQDTTHPFIHYIYILIDKYMYVGKYVCAYPKV